MGLGGCELKHSRCPQKKSFLPYIGDFCNPWFYSRCCDGNQNRTWTLSWTTNNWETSETLQVQSHKKGGGEKNFIKIYARFIGTCVLKSSIDSICSVVICRCTENCSVERGVIRHTFNVICFIHSAVPLGWNLLYYFVFKYSRPLHQISKGSISHNDCLYLRRQNNRVTKEIT